MQKLKENLARTLVDQARNNEKATTEANIVMTKKPFGTQKQIDGTQEDANF